MASEKPFNYHSWLLLPLNHIILTQTCSKLWNDSIEDSEVDKHLEKYILLMLWKIQSQLQVFLLRTANFESDGMMSHKHSLATKTVSKWRPLKWLLSRRISSGTSEAETSVSGKAECLLSVDEDKKGSFLDWPSPLTALNTNSWKDVWSKGNSSHFENSPSFQISWTWSDVFRINENFIQQLSAMFTCWDGKGGELSNQAQKCYIHPPAWWI